MKNVNLVSQKATKNMTEAQSNHKLSEKTKTITTTEVTNIRPFSAGLVTHFTIYINAAYYEVK